MLSYLNRFVLPDARIKIKETESVLKQIASKLFGENNLKNDSYDFLSTNPLALFCKENKQSFEGIEIDGFDFHFCKKTQKIQTEVGVCIASSSLVGLVNGKISMHDKFEVINAGVKDAEHVMIISVDKFRNPDESDFKVI